MLGVGGPMARTAEDVQVFFQVLAGHDMEDPFSAPVPLRAPNMENLRVGLWSQMFDTPMEGETQQALASATRALRDLGVPVDEFRPSGVDGAPEMWWFFFERVYAPFTRQMIDGREEDAHWTGTELMFRALEEPEPAMQDVVVNLAARDRMRTALFREMNQFPVLSNTGLRHTCLPASPAPVRSVEDDAASNGVQLVGNAGYGNSVRNVKRRVADRCSACGSSVRRRTAAGSRRSDGAN